MCAVDQAGRGERAPGDRTLGVPKEMKRNVLQARMRHQASSPLGAQLPGFMDKQEAREESTEKVERRLSEGAQD